MKWLQVLTPIVAVQLVLSGCAGLEGRDPGGQSASDENMAAIATSRLNSDFMTARATLSVTVAGGLATLYGTVPDEATRQRAIQILDNTPGIDEVLDRTRKR